jgi:hypothetical protein
MPDDAMTAPDQSEEMTKAAARALYDCDEDLVDSSLDAVEPVIADVLRAAFDLRTPFGNLPAETKAAYRKRATAAIEALRPFREAAEAKAREDAWQPIETAPRDGTHVVVHARLGHNGKVRRSRRGCFVNVAHFEPSWGWLTSPSDYQIKPTHWRPLPAPPALEQGEG